MPATLPPPLQPLFTPAARFDAPPALRYGRWTAIAVACAHILALWTLLRSEGVRESVRELAPVIVRLVATERPEPAPRPQPLPSPPRPVQPPAPLFAPPELPAIRLPPAEPAPALLPQPPQAPAPARAEPAASLAAPPALPAPPPARKQLPTTALRYLVEPPVELPRASRRAGEQGTVWLRVVVSSQGLPLQVSVQRSSGHARLDEQALWALRQARFQPYTEDGRALEVEAVAVIEYVLD